MDDRDINRNRKSYFLYEKMNSALSVLSEWQDPHFLDHSLHLFSRELLDILPKFTLKIP